MMNIILLAAIISLNFTVPRMQPVAAKVLFFETAGAGTMERAHEESAKLSTKCLQKKELGYRLEMSFEKLDPSISSYRIETVNGYFNNQPDSHNLPETPIDEPALYTLGYQNTFDCVNVLLYDSAGTLKQVNRYLVFDFGSNEYELFFNGVPSQFHKQYL